ncbi:hypothetical protein [Micromonospora sp. NPDC048839]|uniref:hypothetical protein n=1 Tax=Micromonospora sp. NPDC048839 TaxID=3155641 RepID=UPI0034063C46
MTIASDPAGRGTTVTIKHGKGYQDTWTVFKGQLPEVREDLIDFFGMNRSEVESLTLHDLVVNATSIAHGVGNVAGFLGGTVLASGPKPADRPRSSASGDDPWIDAGTTPAKPAENPLLGLIKAALDVPSLERLWAENQAAFSDPAIMDAWKARGREIRK